MTDHLRRAIHDLIYEPRKYWPEDTYFHRRNRQKLARAWTSVAELHSLEPSSVVDTYVEILEHRRQQDITTLYVMSNGGSGCHFLGELLNGLDGLRMTDEVYFPPQLLEEVESLGEEPSSLAIDFINFFHLGTVAEPDRRLTAINLGHVRPDVSPSRLARHDSRGRFLLLLRNPYDVAVSRAFRKGDYRAQVAPDMSDTDYLRRQVAGTRAFLSRCRAFPWDRILRYEHLKSNPTAAVGDIMRELGMNFDVAAFEAIRQRHDATQISQGSPRPESSNFNPKEHELLPAEHLDVLSELSSLAVEFGYGESDLMTRSRRSTRGSPTTIAPDTAKASDGTPEPWLPQYVYEHHYHAARFRRLEEGFISVFRSLPETALVHDPAWKMDPLGNKTWRLFYHTLSWLVALVWGADHGPSPETARLRIAEAVSSYLDANVFSTPADKIAWDDHATADRLAILCHLWRRILSHPNVLIDRFRLVRAAEIHVDKLVEFYQSRRWLTSNHGLFHSFALLSFALTFGDSSHSHRARSIGSEYLREVVSNLVDTTEGISLEQSLYYHQFGLKLLRQARSFLDRSYPDLATVLDGVTDGMVDFNLCVRLPGDVMPAIGDTQVGARIPQDCLQPAPGETSEYLTYIDSGGDGGKPFPRLMVYPNAGYAVFRHGEVWEGKVTRSVFLFQPERLAHGHFDALSLTLHILGTDVLVDSGGPYAYGDPLRFAYFMASHAHNVVLVNGENHKSPARLLDYGSALDCEWAAAEHNGYDGRTVTRTVVSIGEDGFAILDVVTGDGSEALFETLWHFPASSAVEWTGTGRELTTSIRVGGECFLGHTLALADLSAEVVEGKLGAEPQGWITESPGEKRPAPVQVVSARGKEHRALTVFTRQGAQPRASVEEDGRTMVVSLGGRRVAFDRPEAPRFGSEHTAV